MGKRNIKINVYLNEAKKKMLKEKSNKFRLSQSEFIRNIIKEYTDKNISSSNLKNIRNVIFSTIDDLTILKFKMQRLAYHQIANSIEKIIINL